MALRLALFMVVLQRTAYAILAAFFVPRLSLDRSHSNSLTENLMPRAHYLPYVFLGVWERFDTLWYIEISRHGYAMPAAVVFYPLYPLLVRLCTPICRTPLAAAILVCTLSTALLYWGLKQLLELDLQPNKATNAVLALAFWPGSFIFFAAYPDSLACALIVWSIYFARQDRWDQASLLGFAAGFTKAIGTLAVVPLAWLAWKSKRRPQALAGTALCLAPTVLYSIYLKVNALPSITEAYVQFWRTTPSWPWETLISTLRGLFTTTDVLLILTIALMVMVYALAFSQRLRPEYTAYVAATLCLFLTKKTDPILQSTIRYLLVVFPAFPALAVLAHDRLELLVALLPLFALNLVLLLAFWNWMLAV
jgi:hypothetical protein